MSEEKHSKGPAGSAVSSVVGGTKGMFAGGITGGALWAAIGAGTMAAVGAITSFFMPGAEDAIKAGVDAEAANAMGSALSTGNMALSGAILGGIGGGLAGVAGGTVVGGISGAVAANERVHDDGASKEQVAQVAFAQGMMQGAMAAKVEALEHAQAEVSTKWQDRVGPKKQHESHVAMVNDQAAAAALSAMEPQGRA